MDFQWVFHWSFTGFRTSFPSKPWASEAVLRMMYGWLMHLKREDAIETQVPQHMVVRITFDGLGGAPVERRFPLGPMVQLDDGQRDL